MLQTSQQRLRGKQVDARPCQFNGQRQPIQADTNLRDRAEKDGPLDLEQALHYTLQIAEALAHSSSREVVHRDIKPSNVLVTASDQVKLVDMGLARLHHCHFKCTVYYTETVQSGFPFPYRVVKPRVQVVYIDRDHLHLEPGRGGAPTGEKG